MRTDSIKSKRNDATAKPNRNLVLGEEKRTPQKLREFSGSGGLMSTIVLIGELKIKIRGHASAMMVFCLIQSDIQ